MTGRCTERGFAMVVPLVLLALGLTLVLGVAALSALHLRSAGAFAHILVDHYPQSAAARLDAVQLAAPEGWDHAYFSTEVRARSYGLVSELAWQVQERSQPLLRGELPRAGTVALVLDTAPALLTASGEEFADAAVYLRRPDGVISPDDYDLGEQVSLETPAGTYLRGSQANSLYPDGMSWWTSLSSRLLDLELGAERLVLDGHSSAAVAEARQAAVDGWQPAECGLASRLAASLEDLPAAGERQAVVVTNGADLRHGDLAGACESNPCACLVRVAAEARARGVTVHVIGPDIEILRQTAAAGGGRLNPASLIAGPDFVNVLAELDGQIYAPLNRAGGFDLAGFDLSQTRYLDAQLRATAAFGLRGASVAALGWDGGLLVATAADQLVRLNPRESVCDWLAAGVGGALQASGAVLLAGPDRSGHVTALSAAPQLLWRQSAEHCCASASQAYLAQGRIIRAVDLQTGQVAESEFDCGGAVSWLGFDPALGEVWVGLADGTVMALDQDLGLRRSFAVNVAVRGLRNFSWRRQVCTAVASERLVAVYSAGQALWRYALENEQVTAAWVLDRRLGLLLWRPAEEGRALNAGSSRLLEFDALSGELRESRALGAGRWVGPLIDLPGRRLHLASWRGELAAIDLGPLETRGSLGRCLRPE